NNNYNNQFCLSPLDFPTLPGAQRTTMYGYKSSNNTNNNDNVLLAKLDELSQNIARMNESLEKLSSANSKFEKFMIHMIEKNNEMENNIQELRTNEQLIKTNMVQLQIYSNRHENLFTKLLLPMLNDLTKFVLRMNRDKDDKLIDADFGVTLERLRAQLNKALEGKDFC
ncbi:unnamed protein product, partial [Rotaria sp. Silwood2]